MRETPPSSTAGDPVIARGRYLVQDVAACTRCHGDNLAGGNAFDGTFTQLDTNNLPVGVRGVIHAPNLTPDPMTGLGSWTDEQIFNVFRKGVDQQGRPLQGPMPLTMFSGMSDEDIEAIIAYLRTLTPVYHVVPVNIISGTTGNPGATQCIHCHQSRSALDGAPDVAASVQYRGLYLVNYAAACIECHTLRDANGSYDAEYYMAGGIPFTGTWGTSYSANLTPLFLGSWTDEQIAQAIQHGIAPDGHHLAPPMPYSAYAHLSPDDLKAIIAYLRSLQSHPNPPTQPGSGLPSPGGPMPSATPMPPQMPPLGGGSMLGMLLAALPQRRRLPIANSAQRWSPSKPRHPRNLRRPGRAVAHLLAVASNASIPGRPKPFGRPLGRSHLQC